MLVERLLAGKCAEKNVGDQGYCCKAENEQRLFEHKVLQVLSALKQEGLRVAVVERALDGEVEGAVPVQTVTKT